MKKIFSFFLFLIIFSGFIVSSVPVGSFKYYVNGQTVIATPTLSDVTFYRWKLKGDYTSETEWIPISDINNHRFILNWNTSYRITLEYKKNNDVHEFHKIVGIGHDPDPDDNTTISETTTDLKKNNNIFDYIPDSLKNWFQNRNIMEISLIILVFVSFLLFLLQKRSRKTIYVSIDNYGKRRKKINVRRK